MSLVAVELRANKSSPYDLRAIIVFLFVVGDDISLDFLSMSRMLVSHLMDTVLIHLLLLVSQFPA